MKSREFIKTYDKLEPSEELINKTIRKVKEIKKEKGGIKMKNNILKFVRDFSVGVAAMLILSATSFACYIGITGNTEILKKIGINLSKNYTDNAEKLDTPVQYNEKSEIRIKSAAIDKAYLVVEYELKLAKNVQCENPQINSNIRFYDTWTKKYLELIGDVKQESVRQEDGSFILYQVLFPTKIEGVATYDSAGTVLEEGEGRPYSYNLVAYLFDPIYNGNGTLISKADTVKFSVDLLSIKDENGNTIEDIKKDGAFEFELHENDKIKEGKIQTIKDRTDRNIKMSAKIEKQPFATIAVVTVSEVDRNGNDVIGYIRKGNNLVRETTTGEEFNPFANPYDIEKIDVIIKDQDGKIIKEVTHYEIFSALWDANHFERVIILDEENEDVTEYKVELVHTDVKQRDVFVVPYSE